MAQVPFTRTENAAKADGVLVGAAGAEWARIAAGGSLLASALLLLAGKRRAGLLTAIAGSAFILLDQQKAVRAGLDAIPGYIDKAQGLLHRVDETFSEVATQHDRLLKVLNR